MVVLVSLRKFNRVTDLRLNKWYIILYHCWLWILVTGKVGSYFCFSYYHALLQLHLLHLCKRSFIQDTHPLNRKTVENLEKVHLFI